jgi:glycosyltransferase involved in cell wall biosynthesis
VVENFRVVVLGTRGFPSVQGGIETHCENLYPRLVERGCEIFVITRKPYVDVNQKTYRGVNLIPLGCPKNKFLEAFSHTLCGVIAARRLSPAVLHIHGIGPSLCVPLAKLLKLNVVMTNHGADYNRDKWGGLAKSVLRLGERLGSRWANKVICISDPIAENIQKRHKRTVTVIPNGVSLPQLSETQDSLDKHSLTKGQYVLSVGRLVPEKGFHDLVEAFNTLRPNGWKLVIVGRADHEDSYSSGLREKARTNVNIVMTGFLTGKPLQELYSHAGLFVLPSYHEGLPIVLLEAMSYGLSCIASGIPANRNVSLPEDRFFEPGNIDQILAKITKYIDAPLSREEKVGIQSYIAAEYDWESIADKTRLVYSAVVARANC